MKRRYYGYLYVIAYLVLLRVILNITVHIGVFNIGILFDVVLMMFWVGAIAYFMRKIVYQKIWYIFVVVVSSIFTIGDSLYYDYFGIISSRASFAGLKFLTEGQTLEYDISIPLVAYLITPILIGVIYLIITNKKKDVFVLKDLGILSSVFVLQVGLFLYWGSHEFDTRMEYYRSDAYLFESMHDRTDFSEKYGYFNYHILDLTRIREKLDEEEAKLEIDDFFMNQPTHEQNVMSDTYEGYNIITILGETLETRFIDEEMTPNLYMMRENGYSFENYYTPVFQQGATCNSEFMSLTGLQAITTNDWSNNVCDAYSENTFPYSLPAQLQGIGYDTYYFHSGYEWFYNRQTMVPNYGFETVKFQEDIYELGHDDFEERYDRDMLYFFDEFVTYENPFYINLLTYSGHGAYNQTDFDKYKDIVDAVHPVDNYDYEIINYMEKLVETDMMIGDIMDKLEAEGELDNTLFVIFPDHHPYMMDSDIYADYINILEGDPEVHRQDLIIYATDMTGERLSVPGATVDITPTLLNMVYSDGNFDYFMGTDLFSTNENYVIFADLTITNGSTYLDMKKEYTGLPVDSVLFEIALEQEIVAIEIQKRILQTNYFSD